MASLELRNQTYRVVFMHGSRKPAIPVQLHLPCIVALFALSRRDVGVENAYQPFPS
ncbi:hypothetical protein [Fimbriiglobus ruber]|uniref:hypothetical protein n=1 Tax=Fimbriiglobus ruber TaxID=1908690 RepID=UPI00137B37C0|nr:hypothetical protein [Fimbriiglobus ruber]